VPAGLAPGGAELALVAAIQLLVGAVVADVTVPCDACTQRGVGIQLNVSVSTTRSFS
jgi:hypothetical protein